MRNINQFISERLKINKDISPIKYNYQPKDFNELRSLLKKLLKERGKDADLNDIDVSQITTFFYKNVGLFEYLDPHNIDISGWDVSNVKYMYNMFLGCENFNCDLSNWHVSNVENMAGMFAWCEKFTGQGLEKWDISNVEKMDNMFNGCTSLKNKPSWYKE